MLEFYSASARIVNSKRAIQECMEIALGDDYASADLIIINASIGHNFQDLVDQATEMAPNARVVTSSCCGIVGREGVSESMKDIGIMAVKGKDFHLAHTSSISGKTAYEECLKMAHSLKASSSSINMIYFLASGIDIANDQCIRAFEEVLGEGVTIFGATSSDNMKGHISYQAVDREVFEHGAFAVGFSDPTLKVDTQATHGFVAVGEPLIVTKSDGHVIKELNGKPAWEEYTERLGLDASANCGDTIPIGALGEELSIDLAKEYGNKHILRVVTSIEGTDMHFATNCPEGTKLWLTTRDEELIFSEMDKMVESMRVRMGDGKPVAVFHADCLARGRFLFNRIIKEELVGKMQFPFYQNNACPPWLGMYGFGEFARLGGKNEYHNYTTALYVLYR
ncbi:MAG: FIST N-terminal domain-containing protein [Flavobacteriales bacterium]|nr:FIST N-terminal domain-containing protein [Flavobacteriales bacterium]MDG1766893.1 FIST N-terminal domain-containing protein [Flavobacteriales bacterium]